MLFKILNLKFSSLNNTCPLYQGIKLLLIVFVQVGITFVVRCTVAPSVLHRSFRCSLCLLDRVAASLSTVRVELPSFCLVVVVVVVLILQDMYGWPDEPFEEMDSTLAVQQVLEYF